MEIPPKNNQLNFINTEEEFEYHNKHFLLELYGCDYEKLNDESFLRCTLNKAAKLAKARVLNLISNKFEPQGVTAIALLAESHLSIHTWPESHYCAVDIFTCSQNMKPDLACQFLIESLKVEEHLLRVIDRNPSPSIRKKARRII